MYQESKLVADGCTFENIDVPSNSEGATFHIHQGSTATFTDCAFSKITGMSGSAISAILDTQDYWKLYNKMIEGGGDSDQARDIFISGTSFTDIKADTYGGAVFLQFYHAQIINSQFNKNAATIGGGLYYINDLENPTNLVIEGTTYEGNTATEQGAAIAWSKKPPQI